MKKLLPIMEENCCPTPVPTMDRKQAEEGASLFAALGDPTRLAILNLLAQSESDVCVCDITDSFTLGQPTISHHLKILRDADLVSTDKRGKWVHYALKRNKVAELKDMLEQLLKSQLVGR